jgi:hypothetical protein
VIEPPVYSHLALPGSPAAAPGHSLSRGPSQPADQSAAVGSRRESDLRRDQLPDRGEEARSRRAEPSCEPGQDQGPEKLPVEQAYVASRLAVVPSDTGDGTRRGRTNTNAIVLARQLRAIHLSQILKGTITNFPIGARLSIVGPSTLRGFVEVICANVHYVVSEEDLCDRGFKQRGTLQREER